MVTKEEIKEDAFSLGYNRGLKAGRKLGRKEEKIKGGKS